MKNCSFALQWFLHNFVRILAGFPSRFSLRFFFPSVASRSCVRSGCVHGRDLHCTRSRRRFFATRPAVISNTCGKRRRQQATPPTDRSCQRSPRSCPHTVLHYRVKGCTQSGYSSGRSITISRFT